MAGLTTSARFTEWLNVFELGLTEVHKDELKKLPKQYKVWLREERASRFFDVDYSVSGLSVMGEKAIGQTFNTDQLFQGKKKQFALKTYGLALVIQHEAWRWDLYGVFPGLTKQLAKTATDRYNLVAYALFPQAFSTTDSNFQTYQGEPIVALNHTRMDGGTWKNRPTVNGGLSYVMLMQAGIDIRRTFDERGRYIELNPKLLITSVEQEWIAEEILKSKWRPDNAQRNPNQSGDIVQSCHTSPYITAIPPFFVLCDKSDYKIKMSLGEDPDMDTEKRPGTRDRLWSSYCSFRLEVYNSYGWWGSSGDGVTST
jgi:hypothetical protein